MTVLYVIFAIILFLALVIVCLAISCGKMEREVEKYKQINEREDKNMKEITRVITAQITVIESMAQDDADLVIASKEEATANVKKTLEKLYSALDVQVTIQDFVQDKDND